MKKLTHLFKRSIIYLLMTTYFVSYIAVITLFGAACIIFTDLIIYAPDTWFVIRVLTWLIIAILCNIVLRYLFKDDNDIKLLAKLKYGYNVNLDNLAKPQSYVTKFKDLAEEVADNQDNRLAQFQVMTDWKVPKMKKRGRPKKKK